MDQGSKPNIRNSPNRGNHGEALQDTEIGKDFLKKTQKHIQ